MATAPPAGPSVCITASGSYDMRHVTGFFSEFRTISALRSTEIPKALPEVRSRLSVSLTTCTGCASSRRRWVADPIPFSTPAVVFLHLSVSHKFQSSSLLLFFIGVIHC